MAGWHSAQISLLLQISSQNKRFCLPNLSPPMLSFKSCETQRPKGYWTTHRLTRPFSSVGLKRSRNLHFKSTNTRSQLLVSSFGHLLPAAHLDHSSPIFLLSVALPYFTAPPEEPSFPPQPHQPTTLALPHVARASLLSSQPSSPSFVAPLSQTSVPC